MSVKIDQKKYLQKYVNGKRKKKEKCIPSRMKVLDYNEIEQGFNIRNDEVLELYGEDAPQIVGVVEENMKGDSSRSTCKWKRFQNAEEMHSQDLGLNNRNMQLKSMTPEPKEVERHNTYKNNISDISPTRKSKTNSFSHTTQDQDLSPRRKHSDDHVKSRFKDTNSFSNTTQDQDLSPRRKHSDDHVKSRFKDTSPIINISKKHRTEKIKNKITETELSIEPVVHQYINKSTKKSENILKENIKLEEVKNLYQKWGKGVQQVVNYEEKQKNNSYESSKPLARYANDEDLDKYYKEQTRSGDPMLAYMSRKCANNDKHKTVYKGYISENRFNIRPGYRWDGVNRSNGYEQKYFDQQNDRKMNLNTYYCSEDF